VRLVESPGSGFPRGRQGVEIERLLRTPGIDLENS